MTAKNTCPRFGIIGAGTIGRIHAAAITSLAPDAALTLVCDEVRERADNLASAYAAESCVSPAEMIERDDIDAIAVCTPSGQHADLAIAALDAGKHVVVEKPLDVTVEAAERVAAAVARNQRTATVISQHRFDAASQIVHRAVRDGQFGRLTSGAASMAWWRSQEYYDSGDWRGTWAFDGGGAIMNQGIHTVDLLVWIFGDPVEVSAHTACLAHDRIEVEDTAVATVRFANGAIAAIHGTTAAYPGLTARLQIHGDRGSAVIDGDRLAYFHVATPETTTRRAGAVAANQADDMLSSNSLIGTATSGPEIAVDGHTLQYRDLLEAVEQQREPLVSVAEATKTLTVVRALYDSASTGRPVFLDGSTVPSTC